METVAYHAAAIEIRDIHCLNHNLSAVALTRRPEQLVKGFTKLSGRKKLKSTE